MLDPEYLRERLWYDPDTGYFMWLVHTQRKGEDAGYVHTNKNTGQTYVRIGLDGVGYYAHRLAWVYMTGEPPPKFIDHEDGDSLNNSWENLRRAEDGENQRNAAKNSHNSSGYIGVGYDPRSTNPWTASCVYKRKRHYFGSYPTKEQANAAVKAGRKSLGFTDRHGK